jgi:hypothetical protein
LLHTPSQQLWLRCKQLAMLALWQQQPMTLLQLCMQKAQARFRLCCTVQAQLKHSPQALQQLRRIQQHC